MTASSFTAMRSPGPRAQGFAADLIAPPAGAPIHEPVKAVWIIQREPLWCPLAHGDGIPEDEQAAQGFLDQAIRLPPDWSAKRSELAVQACPC